MERYFFSSQGQITALHTTEDYIHGSFEAVMLYPVHTYLGRL